MNFFILAAILLLLIPSRPVEFNPEYISMKQTNIIRGFFLLLVFMIHFCQYIQMNGPTDRIFQFWRPHSGQLVVTLFLLYSGYSVFVSIMKKARPTSAASQFTECCGHWCILIWLYCFI